MICVNITIESVLDFIVAGALILFLLFLLLHLESVFLHYSAQLIPGLAGYVHLKDTAVKAIQASQKLKRTCKYVVRDKLQ